MGGTRTWLLRLIAGVVLVMLGASFAVGLEHAQGATVTGRQLAQVAYGYWLVGADGGVFSFGDAPYEGSLPNLGVHVSDIVGILPTQDNKGYWLVGADGGVFAFGDAPFEGSLPGLGIHVHDIVGVGVPCCSDGYSLVGADGGVFAFGEAPYLGSLPGLGIHVNNITGVAGSYLLVGRDGGVFSFGDPNSFEGSLPKIGVIPAEPIIGIAETVPGYWLAEANGAVFAFGGVPNDGGASNVIPKLSDRRHLCLLEPRQPRF
jgi:hypothetical protein